MKRTPALLTLLALAPLTTAVGSLPAHAAATATAAGGDLGFTVPTVVDEFRPGYEPDVAVDRAQHAGSYAGSTFVSMPNGFSTTESYIWRSDDDRQTFHLTEGNALGKSTTCVGGGDSEMQVDPVNGTLYFADLQGLTNFSNSASTDGGRTWNTTCNAVNGAGVDRQWEAIDDNGGSSAVGTGASDGRLYFDYDNVDQDAFGSGNQLVMNESEDGVHFGAACAGVNAGSTPVSACPEPPAMISPDEGIPGNVVVDDVKGSAYQHRVYAVHTNGNGNAVIVSWCSGKAGDDTAAEVAADCTDPTAVSGLDPNDPTNRTNEYWHDTYAAAPGSGKDGNLFPSIAIDTAGNLYVVWAETHSDGPASVKLAVSTDGAQHWSSPVVVSPAAEQDTVMPWVVAGSPGRIGVSFYGTTDGLDPATKAWGPDAANSAEWNLFYAYSGNALTAATGSAPAFDVTQVNEPGHPIKYGDISTGGLGGTEDRSLGDYFQVQMGAQGQAVITYVDDTSADRNADFSGGTGETPPEAAGPVMVTTQNAGPSLLADGAVPALPTADTGSVSVTPAAAAKDAFLPVAGNDVAAAANQQLGGVSVSQPDATHLAITLTTEDPNLANDLLVSPTLGGATADWLVRWAAPSYDKPGDGNIFYVGMESTAGGAPSFYTGSTQAITTTHTKYFTYPATTTIPGSIKGASITWTVPLSDIGGPSAGQGLYSITGFTATQAEPSTVPTQQTSTGGEVGDENIPNLIGTTPPTDYVLSALGADLPESGMPVLLALLGAAAVVVVVLRLRRRAA